MSERRTAANRANAAKSTGPKTAAGKAIAAQNSTRHAILQGQLVPTRDEDSAALDALRAGVGDALQPVGALECALADRVTGCLWRLGRVQAAEAGLFDSGRDYYMSTRGAELSGQLSYGFATHLDAFATLTRYETALERSMYAALHELQRLQAARAGAPVAAPAVVDVQLHGLPEGVG